MGRDMADKEFVVISFLFSIFESLKTVLSKKGNNAERCD